MKKLLLLGSFFIISSLFAQQAYYNDVDLTLTGIPLKEELATKITSTHTNILTYSEAREALKIVDLNPGQNTNVLLIYGFSNGLCPGSSGSDSDHRRRSKFDFGGGNTCEWNREHTYPKSLGTPNLGTAGPGADAHMLRGADVGRNSLRGSKKFTEGSGNSQVISSNFWYPGDEWKGDVARIMMYMYMRYNSRTLPDNVGVGNPVANDTHMIDLFLDWNAEDPVSQVEINRNNYMENTSNQYGQGNRNPFIDNPFLATRIWGGQEAEDLWGIFLAVNDFNLSELIEVYPNPVKDNLTIKTTNLTINEMTIYAINGQIIKRVQNTAQTIDVKNIKNGLYFLQIETDKGILTKKVVIN